MSLIITYKILLVHLYNKDYISNFFSRSTVMFS